MRMNADLVWLDRTATDIAIGLLRITEPQLLSENNGIPFLDNNKFDRMANLSYRIAEKLLDERKKRYESSLI